MYPCLSPHALSVHLCTSCLSLFFFCLYCLNKPMRLCVFYTFFLFIFFNEVSVKCLTFIQHSCLPLSTLVKHDIIYGSFECFSSCSLFVPGFCGNFKCGVLYLSEMVCRQRAKKGNLRRKCRLMSCSKGLLTHKTN